MKSAPPSLNLTLSILVIPAQAGIQCRSHWIVAITKLFSHWIPAYAGMTIGRAA